MLGLYKEANSHYIYQVCMKEKRRAIQILTDAICLTNDGNPIYDGINPGAEPRLLGRSEHNTGNADRSRRP